MNEHERLDNHEQTQPIEASDTIVPNAETGEVDLEALKREWSAEWQRLLQVDIRSLVDYSPRNTSDDDWKKSLHTFLNDSIIKLRRCGQDSNRLNNQLRILRYISEFLTSPSAVNKYSGRVTNIIYLNQFLKSDKDRKIVIELMSFAIDFMKQYKDYILSLPKPALGSEEELLRPAKGTGSGDVANLVRPAEPNDQPSDDLK